jgi:hypothetical protein
VLKIFGREVDGNGELGRGWGVIMIKWENIIRLVLTNVLVGDVGR